MADDSLPSGWLRVKHDDYDNSGYDRGHMSPSDDRTASVADNAATFIMTNVAPQKHELNAGPWEELENYSRKLATQGNKELFITAGVLVSKQHAVIGNAVAVPEFFYKIVVILDHGQGVSNVTETTRVIAVIMPNATGTQHNWQTYKVSVSQVETKSGYKFFSSIPETVRATLDKQVDAD
jgi:endonuclease G